MAKKEFPAYPIINNMDFDPDELKEMAAEANHYKMSIQLYIRKMLFMARRIEDKERKRLEILADGKSHLWRW